MTASRADLERITHATLAHYDENAEAFWEGTRDHDVRQNVAALLRHLHGSGRLSILDLGCGPGRDLVTFARLGHEAIGVDGAARFVAMARERSGCEVWQRNLLALELPPARFDGVFANAVLQHVPALELPRVLSELHATLRDGGVLFASIPHGHGEEGWNGPRYSVWHAPDAWRAALAAAGFDELEHFWRPEGRPPEEQRWFAGAWRRRAEGASDAGSVKAR